MAEPGDGDVVLFSQLNDWNRNPRRGTLDSPFGGSSRFGSGIATLCEGAHTGDGLVLVGAPLEDDSQGGAAVFAAQQGDGGFARVATIVPEDSDSTGECGASVALAGDLAAVGCPKSAAKCEGCGAVYLFGRNEGGADNYGPVGSASFGQGAPGTGFGAAIGVAWDGKDALLLAGLGGLATDEEPQDGAVLLQRMGANGAWSEPEVATGARRSALGRSVGFTEDGSVACAGAQYEGRRNIGGARTYDLGRRGLGRHDAVAPLLTSRDRNARHGYGVACTKSITVVTSFRRNYISLYGAAPGGCASRGTKDDCEGGSNRACGWCHGSCRAATSFMCSNDIGRVRAVIGLYVSGALLFVGSVASYAAFCYMRLDTADKYLELGGRRERAAERMDDRDEASKLSELRSKKGSLSPRDTSEPEDRPRPPRSPVLDCVKGVSRPPSRGPRRARKPHTAKGTPAVVLPADRNSPPRAPQPRDRAARIRKR